MCKLFMLFILRFENKRIEEKKRKEKKEFWDPLHRNLSWPLEKAFCLWGSVCFTVQAWSICKCNSGEHKRLMKTALHTFTFCHIFLCHINDFKHFLRSKGI